MEPNKNLIFDIGMHIGQDTEYYLKLGYHVVAVDANPELIESAREKFNKYIQSGQLELVNACLHCRGEKVKFYINNDCSEWSSTIEHLGKRGSGGKEIIVPTVRYEDLAAKYGTPYYCKIDIEGADVQVISGFYQCKVRPGYVSYEASSVDGVAHLFAMGYKSFKLIMQRYKTSLFGSDTEKCLVDDGQTFTSDSTGPFGEKAPGVWSKIEDVLMDYYVYKHFRRQDSRKPSDWADFHAKSDRYLPFFVG